MKKDIDDSLLAPLPPHIQGTVRAVAQLHADHHRQSSWVQHAIDRATSIFVRPLFIGLLSVFILAWAGMNLVLPLAGYSAFDPAPFSWLMEFLTVISLYMSILILTTQRRADELASHRDQMTLEVSIVSEQKTAKIIELLEELRRDSPHIRDRVDVEAEAMAKPADARLALDAIADTHNEMIASAPPDGPNSSS